MTKNKDTGNEPGREKENTPEKPETYIVLKGYVFYRGEGRDRQNITEGNTFTAVAEELKGQTHKVQLAALAKAMTKAPENRQVATAGTR